MSGRIDVVAHPTHEPAGVPPEACLWVDDAKPAPDGFAVARTYDDAVRMLRRFRYRVLYLDHDLGESRTGLDLLRQIRAEKIAPAQIFCISWNPAGRRAIEAELRGVRGPGSDPPP